MCYERRDPKQAKACFERDQRKVEYIEREAVRDEFYQCVLDGTITSVEDTGKFLRDFPAADVVSVVHGRWIHDINNLYGCSECLGRETMSHKKLKPYCPNCGAHMKDGE